MIYYKPLDFLICINVSAKWINVNVFLNVEGCLLGLIIISCIYCNILVRWMCVFNIFLWLTLRVWLQMLQHFSRYDYAWLSK